MPLSKTFKIIETLYEDSYTIVSRGVRLRDHKKVILKFLKPESRNEYTISEFLNEQNILEKLNSKNITKLLTTIATPSIHVHVFEDIGAQTLLASINAINFTLTQKLNIAYKISLAIKYLHQKNIIHADINPKNIIYNKQTETIQLIDFGQSLIYSVQNQKSPLQHGTSANIFYISPEQTGLTEYGIDFRSDLYSLGMSLYHLFLGYSPHEANDKYELIHKQIAATPIALHKVHKNIPLVISEIIAKLIEKKPNDRYQNIASLTQDLQKCQKTIAKDEKIKHFKISQSNHPVLNIGHQIFGRDSELSSIHKYIQNNVGKKSINILISGQSGVGKTRLMRECLSDLNNKPVNVIKSKLEQFNESLPYEGFKQLFTDLFTLLMSQLDQNKLLHMSAENASVLSFIFPEISSLFKKNKIQTITPNQDIHTQLPLAVQELFNIIATDEKHLVIVVDDLHWADEASCSLILEAIIKPSNPCVHFISSYRQKEIEQNTHALELLDYINTKESENRLIIPLDSLSLEQFTQMLITLLSQSGKRIERLTVLLYKKTGGNPFYIKTLLLFLLQEEALVYIKGKWTFTLEDIKKHPATNNIVDLLSSQFSKLTPQQKSFLQYLSILGSSYNLSTTLKMMHLLDYKEDLLNEVENRGFIELNTHNYTFVHDQIQKNIYASLSEKEREKFHRKIASYLERSFKTGEHPDYVKLAYHINHAYAPKNLPNKAFKLNILALESLITNNAYSSALEKVRWIQSHLYHKEYCRRQIQNFFTYNYLKTKTYYLNTQADKAFEEIVKLLPYAKDISQKLSCFALLKNISITQGQHFQAIIDFGNQLLSDLNFDVPTKQATLKDTTQNLKNKIFSHPLYNRPNKILKLKTLTHTKKQHILALLVDYWEVAYYLADLDKMQWASLSIIDISFRYGNSNESTFAYTTFAAQLAAQKEYKTAASFGDIALRLNHKFDDKDMLPKVHNYVANFINSYKHSFASNIILYQKSLHQSKINGDIVFGTWANFLMHFSDYLSGHSLPSLRENILKENSFILNSGDEKMISIFNLLSNHVNYLQELSLEDKIYEQEALSLWDTEEFYPAQVWYAIIKAQACFILGNFNEGLHYLDTYVKNTDNEVIMFPKIRLHLIRVLLSLSKDEPLSELQTKNLAFDLDELHSFYKANPNNFRFSTYLIKAESTKDSTSMWDVAKLYDASLNEAKKGNNPFFISIVSLCAGRFFEKLSFNGLSTFYFNEAFIGLNQWGAYAYVKILKQRENPKTERLTPSLNYSSHTSTSPAILEQTNWNSLISSFNAISQAQNNNILIQTLMKIILQNATASKAVLVLQEHNFYKVKSEIDFQSTHISLEDTPLDQSKNIPLNLFAYVINTANKLILTAPNENEKFKFDPYLQDQDIASCLLIPSIIEGKVKALLYLENKDIATPLHEDSIKTLELLLTQAAIVFKNTSLLQTLKASELNLTNAQKISHVGSWQYDSQTQKIIWSAETYRIYNLKPFEIDIDGEWFFNHLPAEDLDYVTKSAEKSLNGEQYYDIKHRIITADKKIKHVHQRAEVIIENGIKILSGTIQDITQTYESKKEILRLSQVVEQSPYTTIITDIQGYITYANQHTFEMTGYTKEELIGKNMNIFRSFIHPDTFYDEIWKTIKEEKTTWKGTIINTIKNSDNIDCQSTIFPIINDKDEIINFVTIQEDVTQSNIKDKLFLMQTRQAQMGEMLSMIAHQWRQPLALINALVNTQRVNILLDNFKSQELIQSYDDVETQVNHLSQTITDFKDFFKPDKERIKTKSSIIITKVISLIKHTLDKQHIRLDIRYKDDPSYLSYEHELEQVILNLFKNSQDAFNERNIQNPLIQITCTKVNDKICIQFEDNAKGIDHEVIDTLFLPYISTKGQSHGTGLGLYMSKTIIEQHCKGTIEAHNTRDGACFTITLPLKDINE